MSEPLFPLASPASACGASDQSVGSGMPMPPRWIEEMFDHAEPRSSIVDGPWCQSGQQASIRSRDLGALCLSTLEVGGATSCGEASFESSTAAAYRLLFEHLASIEAAYPLRVWNFVPEILEPIGQLPHRYMAFNAGRFAAYSDRYGSRRRFPSTLATASGTGHTGSSLVLHCLSSIEPGRPLENPRQVPSYRYTARYGPRPPCFARATLAEVPPGSRHRLLVGGTASVLGENSAHFADLEAQFQETVSNLEALLRAAPGADGCKATSLSQFRHLRVYYTESGARDQIAQWIVDRFDSLESLEFQHSDLCRPELLIEIEGVAEI